jgi:hypothetical protein
MGIAVGFPAAGALAITVIVPTDQPTIQAAVTAAGADGTVIINSNATFNETVTVTQSLTIHGGVGFTPTIRGTSACGATSCTLRFQPNSASPQMLAVSGLRLLPKSGTKAMSSQVVQILNQGAGDATVILTDCTIENPEGFGFLAVAIRRASCSSGLNHVSVHSSSIEVQGDNEAFAGEGGIEMDEGGSLEVSNLDLALSGISAAAFEIVGTPNCGGLTFELSDSTISVSSTTTPFSANLAFVFLEVTATIERTSFRAISNGEGSVGGISVGGGSGQTYTTSITLDANSFVGSGPMVGDAVRAQPFPPGSVVLTATNNVVRDMKSGFRLGQSLGNPAGTVTATLANNTVDGSQSDAIAVSSADGATVTITAENNLLTHSGGWGIAFSFEAGGSSTFTSDHDGFFGNAAGNVEAPLTGGPNDVVDDPIYVHRAVGDLRLGIGSPMINAGDNAAATTTDAAGAMRIQDGIVDIGAFEGAFVVPTPTSTGSTTPTRTGTATHTPTLTRTPSASVTGTRTRTATPSRTISATPTATEPPSRTATPSRTPTVPPSATSTSPGMHTHTPTRTRTSATSPTMTATASTTSAPELTPTQTPTVTPPCAGECNGAGGVTINELLTLVNVALGRASAESCVAGDADGDGQITIAELVKAVNNALKGCP